MVNYHFSAKIFAKQRFRNIIGCRAKATGDEDDIGMLLLFIECIPNFFPHITDSNTPCHTEAIFIKFLCNKSAVGVNNLSY